MPVPEPSDDQLDAVCQAITAATRIVAFTGAGISTDSGIPDFRGPNGVWTKNPQAEKMATIEHYLADPEVRRASWQARLSNPGWRAQPNDGHKALVELEHRGQLHTLITQNVDELHQIAGNSPQRVIEVHGTMRWSRCWTCGDRRPMAEMLARVDAGEADPECKVCRAAGRHGIVKSDTISFGQALVPDVIDRAFDVAGECDLLLAIGSTLQVFPVANVVPLASRAGAEVVIVNGEPTAMDNVADYVVRGSISDILRRIVGPQISQN